MHKIHFRTRLTLTFHNIQINIHIYHDFFSVLAVVVARSFSISRTLWSRTCFSCRLLALEKYTTFLAIYTVSVCVLFFLFRSSSSFSYSRRMSIKFTPAFSLFGAHVFTLHMKFAMYTRTGAMHRQKTKRIQHFFIFHARENHCARCTT